jgi:AAA family ATP:ADP antiporter
LIPLVQYSKQFLTKTFDVREGEFEKVLLMQFNIFLIIFTLLIIKPVVNAQFISTIGVKQLPIVFVLVAISALIVSTFYSRALNTKSLQWVTSTTLIFSIASLIIIGILLKLGIAEKLVLYIFYIGVAIFGVLATSQFWIMANLAFDPREAKRLFNFIGAGPIAGGIAGGYVASLVAYSDIDGTSLLFIAAGLLSICLPINKAIWKKHIRPLNTFQQKKRLTGFGEHPLWIIRKSKHLSYLALIIGLSVVVSKLVEYQFSSVAAQNFDDPDELTAFFGFWFSTFNVVSFVVQLFLTRQIVGTFGVGSSLFALPGGVLVGSILLLVAPVLWAAIFVKLWEVSVKQSVNKSATELLALPIPANIKSQTKSFIDVFVDLAATGVAGLILLFVVNGLGLSVRSISILTIGIVLFWAWVAVKVRHEYIKSFKSKLTQADRSASKTNVDFSNISVINGLKKALELGSENQILYVLEKVRQIPNKKLFDNVVIFLKHDSSKVRVAALKCIYYLEKTVDKESLEALFIDPDLEVRYRAFSQLLRQTKEKRISTINQYLTHQDPLISGAALVGLAEEARNNEEMKKLLKVEHLIREKMDYLTLTHDPEEQKLYKVMILRAIGQAKVEVLYPEIEKYLKDSDPAILNEAILSAGFTLKENFIALIIPFLLQKATKKNAEEALLFYGVGICPILQKMTQDSGIKTEIISQFPAVLAKLNSHVAVKTLFSFLENTDISLRLESLRSLNTMQREFPMLKIRKEDIIAYVFEEVELFKNTLGILYKQNLLLPEKESEETKKARIKLIGLLERRLDSTLERIFRLIGLRYPPEEIMSAYNGIKSGDDHLRLNSVEFLDNLLEPALKKTLVPIAESAFFERLSDETLQQLKVKIPDEKKCLSSLLEGRDIKLKMAVIELIHAMQNKEYKSLIEALLKSPHPKLREQAEKVFLSFNS